MTYSEDVLLRYLKRARYFTAAAMGKRAEKSVQVDCYIGNRPVVSVAGGSSAVFGIVSASRSDTAVLYTPSQMKLSGGETAACASVIRYSRADDSPQAAFVPFDREGGLTRFLDPEYTHRATGVHADCLMLAVSGEWGDPDPTVAVRAYAVDGVPLATLFPKMDAFTWRLNERGGCWVSGSAPVFMDVRMSTNDAYRMWLRCPGQ